MEAACQSFSAQDNRPLKLFFQDEGRFGRICKPSACWVPKGFRPHIKAQVIRQYTHVFSAVCPHDGQTISLILPHADTDAMKIFLGECSKQLEEYRVVMVTDGAAWHKSKELEQVENIRIIHLPPHSPELNPVEHLWEHIREKYLRNFFWSSMEELEEKLEEVLREISKQPDTIQNLAGFHWTII